MSGYQFSHEESKLLSWIADFAYGRANAKEVDEIAKGLGWDLQPRNYKRRIRTLKTRLVIEAGIMIGDVSCGDTRGYFMCNKNDEEDLKIARESVEDHLRPQIKKLMIFTPEADEVLRIVKNMINEIHRED